MKIKKKENNTVEKVSNKVDNKLLIEIENTIKLKEEQVSKLNEEIVSLWDKHAREKYKKYKEGHVYSYSDTNGKEFRGILKISLDKNIPSLNPLKIQVINKDGRLGNSLRIVYNVDLLKYEGEYADK